MKRKEAQGKAHNAARRAAYANDPSYKGKVEKRNRTWYREKRATTGGRPFRSHIGGESKFGVPRMVEVQGQKKRLITFNSEQMADLLGGVHVVVFYRWQRTSKFPKPTTLQWGASPNLPGSFVYTLDEAKQLLRVMADHFDEKLNYRSEHVETRERLFEIIPDKPIK